MVKQWLQRFYIALVFLFLYAPILTLIILSFNASKSRAKWGGFTTKWYLSMFQDETILNALFTTLLIAFLSAFIATIIGVAACVAMNAMKKIPRAILMAVTNIPMLNADIVTGISLMLLFIALDYILQNTIGASYSLGFSSVLISHITFNLPYVILSVMPKLIQTNKNTFEAALDLGASRGYAFYKVILPEIMPGILSGFLLSFTMSLDDFVITHFTKGPGVDTLSTKIYTEVRKGIKPEMYALSTLLFFAILVLLIISNRKYAEKSEKKEAII